MKLIYSDKNSKIYFGDSFNKDVAGILNKNGLIHKKIILLTGYKSFTKSKYYERLKNILDKNDITVVKHIKVKPNPNKDVVLRALSKSNYIFDFIFAIGGGSVIDAGKLIKHHFNNSAKLLTIYTLLGSATAVSPFAIFNNNEFKIGIGDNNLIPNYSYINSQIISSINTRRRIIAVSDIFAHATESLYSKESNTVSRNKSKMALKILISSKIEDLSLINFVKSDIYAGLGERVGLVLFPHAASHYLTYKFNIPHGIATMYFLPQYLKLLLSKGVDVDSKHIQYAKYLESILKDQKMIKKISLSEKEVNALFTLSHKYMVFSYQNAPIVIKQEEYEMLLKDYVKK